MTSQVLKGDMQMNTEGTYDPIDTSAAGNDGIRRIRGILEQMQGENKDARTCLMMLKLPYLADELTEDGDFESPQDIIMWILFLAGDKPRALFYANASVNAGAPHPLCHYIQACACAEGAGSSVNLAEALRCIRIADARYQKNNYIKTQIRQMHARIAIKACKEKLCGLQESIAACEEIIANPNTGNHEPLPNDSPVSYALQTLCMLGTQGKYPESKTRECIRILGNSPLVDDWMMAERFRMLLADTLPVPPTGNAAETK